jgi:hypothetical protein
MLISGCLMLVLGLRVMRGIQQRKLAGLLRASCEASEGGAELGSSSILIVHLVSYWSLSESFSLSLHCGRDVSIDASRYAC